MLKIPVFIILLSEYPWKLQKQPSLRSITYWGRSRANLMATYILCPIIKSNLEKPPNDIFGSNIKSLLRKFPFIFPEIAVTQHRQW